MGLKQLNVRMESELVDGLGQVRERTGVGVSEQVRRAIRSWLDGQEGRAQTKADGVTRPAVVGSGEVGKLRMAGALAAVRAVTPNVVSGRELVARPDNTVKGGRCVCGHLGSEHPSQFLCGQCGCRQFREKG